MVADIVRGQTQNSADDFRLREENVRGRYGLEEQLEVHLQLQPHPLFSVSLIFLREL